MIDTNGPGVVTLGVDDRALAVAAVKAVLRVAAIDEDALIAAFVESALGLAEQFIGQVLIARSLRETVAVSSAWQRLGAAPVRAISGVETVAGVALAAGGYAIDLDAAGDGWVRVSDAAGATRVAVPFTAGLAVGWAQLPMPLRQGVVLLAAYLFDARDAGGPPPLAVTALWRPFRRITLGAGRRAC
ncbi:hypothetical protein U1872_10320 [Sphingomonas sp. RB3P16]|uniref:head-tail connector protein n=1 Tax=Parasphingomonas frigoris TaxID=3096163 RepID=UPI002FC5CCFB